MNAAPPVAPEAAEITAAVTFHLRFGWWCSLLFLTLGLALEAMHAYKLDLLLNVENETRREMWTLAHAHGTLLGLMHIAFAFTVQRLEAWPSKPRSIASKSLTAAALLIPIGFFLGGVTIHAGDPGLGVLLVPPGGILLVIAALLTALAATRGRGEAAG